MLASILALRLWSTNHAEQGSRAARISILGNSPLLPRENNLFSDCSEFSLKFLFIRILQLHTTYIRFQLSLGLIFEYQGRVVFD